MTARRSRNRSWVLAAVAFAVPVLVIVGLRLSAKIEGWPTSLGANSMGRPEGQPLILYSCDNAAALNAGPCREPADPDYMKVVLYDAPAGNPRLRFTDTGAGIAARTLELRFLGGAVWVKVEARGRRGWIERDYTR